ncbi:MAG TPA: Tol-Pal system beta propeller repeat protein TolB [Steroidobacteraceae bacterium]
MSFIRRPAVLLQGMILALCAALPAHAQLQVEITKYVTDPIPIAVVPFSRAVPADGGLDVTTVVISDLTSSGRFRLMPRGQMTATPTKAQEVVLADWKAAGNDYVVVGRVSSIAANQLAVDFDLVNVLTGQTIATQRFTGSQAALRNAAHRVSDVVYEKILGVRGAFATRIAYVSVDGAPPTQKFQLFVADADGENRLPILESKYPIMSPAWSNDGQWLAYVSFEGKRSSVFVQRVRTGERARVSARAGINGAPAFSPDGKKIALTLGGTAGNPDIYVLDLSTQDLLRVTDDPAIDTEAVWSPDGQSLYFTSDRAGSPQIYRIGVKAGERPKRITFGGSYNARPRISPDGGLLAMVTLDGNNYRIAVQNLSNNAVQVLSKGRQDESPSFAPNGAMVIYTGQEAGRTVLATVATDGQVGQLLKSDQGEVREPVWGPFTP